MSKGLIGRIAAIAAVVVLVAVVAVLGKAWWDSRLPDTYNVMAYGTHDYGGGPEPPNHAGHGAAPERASPTCTGRATARPTRASS